MYACLTCDEQNTGLRRLQLESDAFCCTLLAGKLSRAGSVSVF